MQETCPVCAGQDGQHYHRDGQRDYWQCPDCDLVFVPASQRLTPSLEKYQYDQHQNNLYDAGYRQFLSRAADVITQRFPLPAEGLDFGCGPCPTLAAMLIDSGHQLSLFDHYYFHNPQALARSYDFIVSTEVVEHLSQPGKIVDQLVRLLKPGGALLIMTKRVQNRSAFARWHYTHDPTHIVFFSEQTFAFLAQRHGLSLSFPGQDLALLSLS